MKKREVLRWNDEKMIGIERIYEKSGNEKMCGERMKMQGKLRECKELWEEDEIWNKKWYRMEGVKCGVGLKSFYIFAIYFEILRYNI